MNLRFRNDSRGFTLVELMIAMAFIAMLLLAIAMLVIQIGGTYNKGVTMKSVNQAGRAITEDMRRTIAASKPFDATVVAHYNDAAGRLCTGTYSYIWNKGSLASPANEYAAGPHSATPIRFVKVIDNGAGYCADPTKDIVFGDATELLSENNLAVQLFSIRPLSGAVFSGSKMYGLRMVLSDAGQESVYVNTIDDSGCKAPGEDGASPNHCAVNVVEFTALAGRREVR